MSFSFKTKFNNMTYKDYLKQPKSMLEWKSIEKFMLEIERTIYRPLTHAYGPIQDEERET